MALPDYKKIYKTHKDELSVPPLTKAEEAWCERFNKCLRAMPKRLYVMEAGDTLSVLDRGAASESECHDGGADAAGIVLCDIPHGNFTIFGVSA